MIKYLLCVFYFLYFAFPYIHAQEVLHSGFSHIQGVFWVTRDDENSKVFFSTGEVPQTQHYEDYILDLLELARKWFSGMIYGYEFYYQPLDVLRQVEEVFVLSPIHEIPWGDEGLEYIGAVVDDEKIEMSFRYFPKEYEISRLHAWRSMSLPNISGQASVDDMFSFQSRILSFEAAVKEAIRNYFRGVSLNKPQEITGHVALFNMPRSFIRGGSIYSFVKIIIDEKIIVPYRQF